jgi:hypothetical protein
LLDIQQQFDQVYRSLLLVAFFDENQAAQMMGMTQGMPEVVELEVGGIIIMHSPTLPFGQDPNVFQGR